MGRGFYLRASWIASSLKATPNDAESRTTNANSKMHCVPLCARSSHVVDRSFPQIFTRWEYCRIAEVVQCAHVHERSCLTNRPRPSFRERYEPRRQVVAAYVAAPLFTQPSGEFQEARMGTRSSGGILRVRFLRLVSTDKPRSKKPRGHKPGASMCAGKKRPARAHHPG